MIRNIKALGLLSLAALAVCAVFAPSSPAQLTTDEFTAESYPQDIQGTDAKGVTTIETEGGTLECEHSVSGKLWGPSRTLTLNPTYSNCTFLTFSATVTTHGCDYLYLVETKEEEDVYQASMDIVCPAGKAITVTVHTLGCKFQIDPQVGLRTVDFENMTKAATPDMTMSDTVSGVHYTVTQDPVLCPFKSTGTKADGKFISHAPMTLEAEEGIAID